VSNFAWVVLGGAAGTGARYLLSAWLVHALGPAFPYGTFGVNLLGSFAIGLLLAVGTSSPWFGPTTMLALTTGFLGGFTTYSTFSLETFQYVRTAAWGMAAAYVATTVLVCLAGTAAGFALGQRLVPSGAA
jgi:CrcB protein